MSSDYVVQLERPGDGDVFRVIELRLPPPGRGEVRLRQTAVAVNFLDVYHRRGLYPLPAWPAVPGVEAAGIVEALGEGVTGLSIGQRVAYAGLPVGAYASVRNLSAERLVPLPDEISDELAATTLLRGITAYMLLEHLRPTCAGDTVLVHAAAGGLGQVLGQWRCGARLIGTAGSERKRALARSRGYDEVLPYRDSDFVEDVRRLTAGRGVDYAIDGIGGETLRRTLRAVRPFGMVASVGQAGGVCEDLPLTELGPARSITLSRPGVMVFMRDPARWQRAVTAVQARWRVGLEVEIGLRLPLREAAQAHRQLELGTVAGAVVLRP